MAHAQRTRPAVVAFDVVGTLFSLDPLATRMRDVGLRGARSCPLVRRYDADALESQLDDATRSYLEQELTVADHVLYAPELFRWFRDDFETFPGGLQGFLLRHLPPGAVRRAVDERGLALIEYRPYDWRLIDDSTGRP